MPKAVVIKEFQLETRYLGDKIHLKKFREKFSDYKYLNDDHPLVVETEKEKYAVLTKFGVVSFWNFTEAEIKSFLEKVSPFVTLVGDIHESHKDSLKIFVGGEEEKATFEDLYIKDLDIDKIKIISYISAQSVALDRYEEEIDARLHELGRVVSALKAGSKAKLKQADILKQVGSVLSVKQSTVSRLSLFDKPDETWEREEIERLYDKLRNEYELRDRFEVLNEKIDFLSENNNTLLSYLASQKSNYLEIIVIILIVVELLLFVFELLKA